MNVQMIARLARLSARKIRYVLDQRLLPGTRGRSQKHLPGQPRSYTKMEGYFIACAATLLAGGVQRTTISTIFSSLADIPWPFPGLELPRPTLKQRVVPQPRTALEALYLLAGERAAIKVGDGINLCLRLRGADTGWFEPRSLALLDKAYRPAVVIVFDLHPLLSAFEKVSSAD
jgi:hypothetical protein